MTFIRMTAVLITATSLCSGMQANGQQSNPQASEASWGFDIAGMDPQVRPGDNFARYAFGGWYRTAVIPDGAPAVGLRLTQMRANEQKIGEAIEAAVRNPNSANRRLISTLYTSYVDTRAIDERGDAPLRADLAHIRNARTKAEIARIMGLSASGFGGSLFEPDIDADRNHPNRHALYLDQGGLGGGNRNMYLDPEMRDQKLAYQKRLTSMLELASWPDPVANAAAVTELETRIAKASWTRSDSIDIAKINHVMSVPSLERLAPGFPWRAYLSGLGVGELKSVIVEQDSAFTKFAKIFATTPLSTLKAWAAAGTIAAAAPYLPSRFRGQSTPPNQRAMGAMRLIDATLIDAVAQEYMRRFFPPESKAEIENIVRPVKAAMAERIRRNDWLKPSTKAEALKKLAKLRVSVGYPARWRDYSGLRLRPDDLYGNMKRIAAFDWARKLRKLRQPVDRDEWFMAPQAVGAQSNRSRLHLTFSAGLLQPPFFDARNDAAVNYGAIGGVIGHEIGHLFDDQGAQIDAAGQLRNWWGETDEAEFKARTGRLAAMIERKELSPDEPVDGRAILSETMANLLGQQVALDAYHAQLGGKPAPVLGGFTGDQRFFLSFAQTWKAKAKPDFWKEMGNQAPPEPSVNIVVQNIDAWYTAFGVSPHDKLYLKPEDRIRIW